MKTLFISFCVIMASVLPAISQETTTVLIKTEIEQAIDKTCQLLNRFYVFPEVATQMEEHIKAKFAEGAFDTITDPNDFVNFMTTELRSIYHDKHLGLYIGPNPDEQTIEDRTLNRSLNRLKSRRNNYGMTKVEILDGNVGYMSIRSVMYSEQAMEVLRSVLRFLSNTDAIIFDLRKNRGGDPSFMAYMFSYFLDKPTHINSIYWRDRDRTDEFWTREDVPGKKLVDVPLFVLISNETFSGAEEFAYDLQALKRATIIGEVSEGAANPSATWVVYKDIRISIPFGRAINPITGTNWEGTGVIPDIDVPADEALEVSIEKATSAAERYYTTKKNRIMAYYEEHNSHLEKAVKLFKKGNTKEAEALVISSLEIAIELDFMNESSINRLGYDYLGKNNSLMAIAIFKCNVLAYPQSANVYDSLGEAYLENGDTELAINNYKKALEIDPNKVSAKRALEEINK